MKKENIHTYFDTLGKSGGWGELYKPGNPKSYSFIVRLEKSISLMDDPRGKEVCDLGCGTGVLVPFVTSNGGNYTGLDNSEGMLESIRAKFGNEIERRKVKLVYSGFYDFKPSSSFDIITGLGFIEYFDEPEKALRHIYEMMSPGGSLILSFPNSFSLDTYALRLFAPFRSLARLLLGKGTPQPPRKLWTVKNATAMLSAAGFKEMKRLNYSINFLFYPFSRFMLPICNAVSSRLEYSFLSKFSFFSTGFIVSCKK